MSIRIPLLSGLAVLAVAVLGFRLSESVPGPGREASSSGPVGQSTPGIDSTRLMTHLSILAHDSMEGRGTGTEGAARARRYLLRALAEAGVEPVGDSFARPFELEGRRGVNLVGRVPGGGEEPAIVLSAHYDHEGMRGGEIYNGADDNASGVATVLELARVLRDAPARHRVIVALFDAEESGLLGARAFVSDPPIPLEDIGLDVNLDMVSRADGLLWAAGARYTPELRPPLAEAAEGAPLALRLGHDRPGAPEGDDWTLESDHAAFFERGIPFVYFGVDDHPDYHRPTDDVERVDPADFLRSARTILMALRALDRALPFPLPEPPR